MVENVQGINYFQPPNLQAVWFINCDGKTVESTNTLSGGVAQRFAPFMVVAFGRDIQGVTDGPTISIGTNAPNYDDVMAATDLGTGLIATNKAFTRVIGLGVNLPDASTDLVLRVRATASGGTTYLFDVLLIGLASTV